MQIILAYAAWGTLFSLLSGLSAQPKNLKPDVKLPDQAKLQGYLERCEKSLKTSWIIEATYTYRLTRSSEISDENIGRAMLIRVPFLPEVFLWQSTEKGKDKNRYFKLHVGNCRLFWSPTYHNIGFDLPIGDLHIDWVYLDTIWKTISGALLIWDSSATCDVNFRGRTLNVTRHEKGFFRGVFESYIASRGPLFLLLGMDAKQSIKRFEIKLTKDDKNYVYLEAFPRTKLDRIDFVRAQVVFDKSSFLPRRLWYAEADGDTNTFLFAKILTVP
jgi:hypothetical protein